MSAEDHPYARRIFNLMEQIDKLCIEKNLDRDTTLEWARQHFQRTNLCIAEAYEVAISRIRMNIPLENPGTEIE